MDRIIPDAVSAAKIEQNVKVVAVADGLVWVEARRASACGSCSLSRGCGTAVVAKLLGEGHNRFAVTDPIGVAIGDPVVIGIADSALTRASLLAYLLPLAALMAAAFLAEQAGAGEVLTALFGLFGLALGLWGTGRLTKRSGAEVRYRPIVLRRRSDYSVGPLGGPCGGSPTRYDARLSARVDPATVRRTPVAKSGDRWKLAYREVPDARSSSKER